jgi:hypothetical protein
MRPGRRTRRKRKEEGVEETRYRLHPMNMGEGVVIVFKYPVCWFHQDELKWLCTRV